MNRSLLLAGTVLTLFAACSDQQPTGVAPLPGATAALLSHSPAHHGVRGQPDLASTPAYSDLDAASATGTPGSLHLSVEAGGPIPRFPDGFMQSVAVFGYAWVDASTGRGVVAVIHPAIGPDSRQNPNGWHTHPVQLTAGTVDSDLCVLEIGTSQGGISIHGDVLRLSMAVQQAGVSAAELNVAASFIVQPDAGCTATQLGVKLLGSASL